MQQDDFLVRDRPVSRSTLVINDEKSYYQFEDGLIVMNHEYLNEKLSSNFCFNKAGLRGSSLHVIK